MLAIASDYDAPLENAGLRLSRIVLTATAVSFVEGFVAKH